MTVETDTDFDFAEVDIPPRTGGPGRPTEFNPFLDKVAELVDADGTPRDVAVSFTLADGPESDAAIRIKRQLARAGIVHNVSVFKRIEAEGTGSRVTFWAQDRIVPVRKPKEAASVEGDDETSEDVPSGVSGSSNGGVTRLEP